jgi:hypothetical protein
MSSETELDALLRRVPESPAAQAEVADDRLVALRSGRMSPTDAVELERAVADDPEARGLLMALAEPVSPALRSRAMAVLPRRPAWWPALWALPLAAAAAGLWLAWPRLGLDIALLEAELAAAWGEGGSIGSDHVQALGGYTLEGPFGGQQLVRSEQASTVFGPESRFKLVLRPQGPGAEALRVFVEGRPVPATVERGEGGVFRVQAPGATLFGGPAGPRLLQVVLGPRAVVEAAEHPTAGAGVSIIDVHVEWRPEGVEP